MTALAGRCCGGLILANLRVSGVDEMRNDIGGYEICWLVILVITVDPKLSTCVCTVSWCDHGELMVSKEANFEERCVTRVQLEVKFV